MTKKYLPQIKIPAFYMRGGTSKGVFFKLTDLPDAAQVAGEVRDNLLLRIIGSPDPYGKHTDGMGGATSSTAKTAIISKSDKLDHDVNYLFGQVAIDRPFIDWSGNCGNLTSAVGIFAINNDLIDATKIPQNGICTVRIWQENINKTIIAYIPITDGQVQESGDFELDGVTFPAAEIKINFIAPADNNSDMFPTGNLIDKLEIPNIGILKTTIITAGIPTIFINATDIGYTGTELQDDINKNKAALTMFETIRAYGQIKMGLIKNISEASNNQHIPKIAFIAPPADYTASNSKMILSDTIDLNVRALSMGKLHHAMMGTVAVAIATAATIPGTLVNIAAGGGKRDSVIFGHPSGTLSVGGESIYKNGHWQVNKVSMSRSARVLMEGCVLVPANCF